MSPIGPELRQLARLATPVIVTQVGSMMLGLVDLAMVGRLGTEALSAVALGDLWIFGTLIAGIALVMGIDPIVSQAHGAGRGHLAGLALQRCIVLSVLSTIPLYFLWQRTDAALIFLQQSPSIASAAQDYASVQIFSAAPFLVFVGLRHYLQGRGIMMVPLFIIAIANLANVLFNYALIYGHFGCPALGVQGAGIATGLTRVFMAVALAVVIYRWRLHEGAWQPWSRESFLPAGLWQVLKHGLPIAAMYSLEVWAFTLAGLLAGRLEPQELNVASHTIVLKLASFSFMFPLGVSIAASTRVGNLLGARRMDEAQHSAMVALAFGAALMSGFAVIFVLFRGQLPGLFTDASEVEVIALAASVLPIAAAFQLFDGTQAVAAGILRGMGQTLPAAVFNLVAFYLIGFPVALWLSFPEVFAGEWPHGHRGMRLEGIWWGLCSGLAAVALLEVLWIWKRGPSKVQRLAVD
ncbi:MAG: MATE family efflux transporter [Planctomycetota bacterium]